MSHSHSHSHDHSHLAAAEATATAARSGLVCTNVTVCYPQRQLRPAVHHLDACLPLGGFVGIVGPNGAGKSTLLHAILGWLPLTSGSIVLDGSPIDRCLSRIAYLPQRKTQDLDFPIDVETVVAMGRFQCLGSFGGFAAADQTAIDLAIADMGLTRLRRRPISQLSGGQQQRAFIARALATGADVLLLDEPLAGLDDPTSHDLLRRLRSWVGGNGGRRLAVAVIHDLAAARQWCSDALLLNKEGIACGPVATVMTEANLAKAFPRSGAAPASNASVAPASAGPDGGLQPAGHR